MKCVAYSLITILCLAATSRGAEFFGLGDLPGGRYESFAFRVSGDGSTVVGYSGSAASGTRNEAFRWTRATGMVSLGDLPGGEHYGAGIGVSFNGSVVVGASSSQNGEEAFRWTSSTGMVGQGDLPGGFFSSQFQSVSADGNVAVGDGCSGLSLEATRWSPATGLVGLGDFPGGRYLSQAIDVSSDGSVVVGQGYPDVMYSEAFRWTQETGMVGLGDLPGGDPGGSLATAVSADGRVIVGQGRSAIGGEAFRWTAETGMVGLGSLGGVSGAMAVSGDGSVVVGESNGPFIWTEATGMRNLKDVLEEQGIDLGGWNPYAPRSISWDGRVIVGWGNNPHFDNEAWMAILSTNDSSTGGDTDADGDVDLDDLNNVRNHFGEMGVPVSGDTNEDYIVDLDDLNAVRNHFGASTAQAVPEPSSLVLLSVIASGLIVRRRTRLVSTAIFAFCIAGQQSARLARATQYSFTEIATREAGFTSFPGMSPAIADDGNAIFTGFKPATGTEFFVGGGQSLSIVPFPFGGGGGLFPAALNSNGQATANTPRVTGQQIITRVQGGVVETIDLKPFGDLGAPDINELGHVSYGRKVDPGLTQIVVWDGAEASVIANSTIVGDLQINSILAINDNDAVAFNAGGTILVGRGGELEVDDYVVIASDVNNGFPPTLNDRGMVAFRSSRSGVDSVLFGDGGPLSELTNTSGPYATFGDPTINNDGTIAFKAALDDGTEGIYTGPDPIADRIIASGDALSGSTVSALRFTRNGLNNRGEIVFWALMLDGQEGIFRATPVVESTPGDTNGDGKVDLEDLNSVRNNFGGMGSGDADSDGDVDLDDLNTVRNNFGASSANPVPEPSSLSLLALGAMAIVGYRRLTSPKPVLPSQGASNPSLFRANGAVNRLVINRLQLASAYAMREKCIHGLFITINTDDNLTI